MNNFTPCLLIYATVVLDGFQGHGVICQMLNVLRTNQIAGFVTVPSWKI